MKITWLEKRRQKAEPPIENLETPLGTGKTFVHTDYKESTKALRFDLEENPTLFAVMVRELNTEAVNFRIRQEENLVWIEL